jgi:hypothetical protein
MRQSSFIEQQERECEREEMCEELVCVHVNLPALFFLDRAKERELDAGLALTFQLKEHTDRVSLSESHCTGVNEVRRQGKDCAIWIFN